MDARPSRSFCVKSGALGAYFRPEAIPRGCSWAITYNNFLADLDVPAAHAVVAAAGIAPNANPDDGDDLSMPAQGVARTVDPRTGLRSYSTSAYFDAEAHVRDNLYVVTNGVATIERRRKQLNFRAMVKRIPSWFQKRWSRPRVGSCFDLLAACMILTWRRLTGDAPDP
ncbi:hypothetical protein EDB85DRAFT_1218084 [Lactarius pseudohatsudake]|nr:hypothetical protein EDB85DRAFT_1218084 [Lactarius pseudohatsudake]